jgi:hypothetical protein
MLLSSSDIKIILMNTFFFCLKLNILPLKMTLITNMELLHCTWLWCQHYWKLFTIFKTKLTYAQYHPDDFNAPRYDIFNCNVVVAEVIYTSPLFFLVLISTSLFYALHSLHLFSLTLIIYVLLYEIIWTHMHTHTPTHMHTAWWS